MTLVHHHLVVSARVRNPIQSITDGKLWLGELIVKLGMYQLAPMTGDYCQTRGNRGLTLLAPITTSHLALHIWDEENPARLELDVYSCKTFDPMTVHDHLAPLDLVSFSTRFLDREWL